MKKYFENPEIELEKFHVEDVLTTSTDSDGFTPEETEDMDVGV